MIISGRIRNDSLFNDIDQDLLVDEFYDLGFVDVKQNTGDFLQVFIWSFILDSDVIDNYSFLVEETEFIEKNYEYEWEWSWLNWYEYDFFPSTDEFLVDSTVMPLIGLPSFFLEEYRYNTTKYICIFFMLFFIWLNSSFGFFFISLYVIDSCYMDMEDFENALDEEEMYKDFMFSVEDDVSPGENPQGVINEFFFLINGYDKNVEKNFFYLNDIYQIEFEQESLYSKENYSSTSLNEDIDYVHPDNFYGFQFIENQHVILNLIHGILKNYYVDKNLIFNQNLNIKNLDFFEIYCDKLFLFYSRVYFFNYLKKNKINFYDKQKKITKLFLFDKVNYSNIYGPVKLPDNFEFFFIDQQVKRVYDTKDLVLYNKKELI